MTLTLIALWIAGFTCKWYWFAGAFLLDAVWLSIKLNFIAALVRRSVEQAMVEIARQVAEASEDTAPPSGS